MQTTGIWYLSSKTYSEHFQAGLFTQSNPPGRENGRYYFHGIDTQSPDLADAFTPVPLEGRAFRNNPNRIFQGGIHHSRPGLVLAGDYVYTAFASHCVLWNFTGAVIGHNKRTGAVVEMLATQGGPEPNTIRGGGIWMSGGGISYDGAGSLFFATGNGYASQLSNTPVPGRQPPSALEEAAVNAKINDDGTLTVIDFFMPWEKQQLDGADKDLGTTPLELLPTDVFTCSNVRRMGVVTGKSGKTYVLNLDNLGGYQMGANRLDNVVFMYQHENSVYAGAGVMPLGGGYLYINVIRYQTRVFKFSCDGAGNPQFTVVAYTKEMNAYILGTGHGTTTSLNGRKGTGIFWLTDIEGVNLRIYDAIPPISGGNLTLLNSFNVPGITKFTRAVFGDGITYLGSTTGAVYAFGSPVNLPLNCSPPYDFGRVPIKNTSTPLTITCKANVATTLTGVGLIGNSNFNISSLPPTNLQVAKDASFSFQAVFIPQSVGPLSSDVIVNTTNSVAGYSTRTPITLKGTGSSTAPLLAVGPNTVSFNIIAGEQVGGVNQTSIFSNVGDSLLTIRNISYSLKSEKGPWVTPNITTTGVQVGPFTFYSVPTTIAANGQNTVTINYNPTIAGNDACFLSIASDGGTAILDVVAVAGTYPTAVIEFEKFDGTGWTKLDNSSTFSFGNVTENQTRNLRLRVTNNGSASAVPLSITVSKPPVGVQGIIGAVNNIDLGEGTIIAAGQSATAVLYCSVPKAQYNMPAYYGSAQWVMNTADVNLGKQTINFACTAVTEQVGPLFNNGSARFGYAGCYRENNPGRQLAYQAYGDGQNTIQRCVNLCSAAGWYFAATQYQQECWCGNAVPIQRDTEPDCNYQCTGNANQTCGGNGYFGDKARMSLFADLTIYQNVTSPPLAIPQSVGDYKYIGCYSQKNGKAMNSKSTADPKFMSVSRCAAFCSGFNAFSLEFAQECFCGAGVNTQYATLTADSNCMTMTCKGNNSEFCGAANLAQVYSLNGVKPSSTSISVSSTSGSPASSSPASAGVSGWSPVGCWTDNVGGRALTNLVGDNAMTLNLCASTAQSAGSTYFGVEYGSECWHGKALGGNNVAAPASDCSFTCPGNAAQFCGAGNRLSLWQVNASSSSTSSSSLLVSASSTSAGASATSSTPSVPTRIGNYTSLGCYTDNNGGIRALPSLFADDNMTLDLCVAQAQSRGLQYAGASYGRECWMGSGPVAGGNIPTTQDRCSMRCPGNQVQFCGSGNFLQMYNFSQVAVSSSSSFIASSSSSTSRSSIIASSSVVAASTISLTSLRTSTVSSSPASSLTSTGASTSVGPIPSFVSSSSLSTISRSSSITVTSSLLATSSTMSSLSSGLTTSSVTSSSSAPPSTSRSLAAPTSSASISFASSTTSARSSAVSSAASSASPLSQSTSISVTSRISSLSSTLSSISGSAGAASQSSLSSAASTSTLSGLSAATSTSSPRSSSSTGSSRGVASSSISTASSKSTSITSTFVTSSKSSAASSAPTALPTVDSYAYMGCYNETSGRTFNATSTRDSAGMTVPKCADFCSSYAYFGLEMGVECWCGPYPRPNSGRVPNQADCNMPCVGDKTTLCGAANRLNVYYSADADKSSIDPVSPQTVGDYKFYNCVNDSPRLLATKLSTSKNMTVEMCMDLAAKGGYSIAGLEYSVECWAGNELRAPLVNATAAACNMVCGGNVGQICGAGSRLSLYRRSP